MSQPTAQDVQTFARPGSNELMNYLAIAGGIGAVAFAIAGFFVCLYTSAGIIALQGMSTVPMLFAVALFAKAWTGLRSPKEVRVTLAFIEIAAAGAVRRWNWEQIASAETGTTIMGMGSPLIIRDTDDRVIARLSGFDNVETLKKLITHRIAQHSTPGQAMARKKRSRKTSRFLVFGGGVALALAGANFWMAIVESENAKLIAERAAPATGKIVKKVIAPDGRTHRIEYRVVGEPNAPAVNVEVSRPLWLLLNEEDEVKVIAVPGRPDLSRLVAGQVDDHSLPSPRIMMGLSACIALLGVFFICGGILEMRGLTIKLVDGMPRLRPKREPERS